MTMLAHFTISNCNKEDFFEDSGIKPGKLVLPDGLTIVDGGDLIAFAEDSTYLHCLIIPSAAYYGVFKSSDKDHLYQHLLRLNT